MSTRNFTQGRRVFVRVRGIVQGVGFRPFIFQLACRHELKGWVRNESDGVQIEVAGSFDRVEKFLHAIPAEAPPLALICEMEVSELPFSPLSPFSIVKSHTAQCRSTLIAPDVCTCGDCLRELFNPVDRRYLYPFINCTNCGPRYTIIKDIPYDREKTTMSSFYMCPSCRREYEDPANRRFHAQPNACWDCGPSVWLEDARGETLAEKENAIEMARRILAGGGILAIKGLGGFHLAVDATDEVAVKRLRGRKVREEKPFAVMFTNLEAISSYCETSSDERMLLESPERPIVILNRCYSSEVDELASSIAPENRHLGAFLPYTPIHFLLFHDSPYRSLVMTSGNQSDEPIVTSNQEAREKLKGIAEFFLFHNRDIYMRCDDSVARMLHSGRRSVRRARGFVPVPVFLRDPVAPVLGVGAELKNTVCLTRGREAFLSQHIGDLENFETLKSFESTIDHLRKVLSVVPECVIHDLHPDYLSTQWALEQPDVPRIAVQHHHAHIAAVVAERRLSGPVIGMGLDGTGYGSDGTIWGGEILLVDGDICERLGHFRQVPLPGGNIAIREPWRMAASYLWSAQPETAEIILRDLLRGHDRAKLKLVLQMLEKRINAPLTSSCGRLFDAVAALVGLPRSGTVNYEGQAAIELEQGIERDDGLYHGKMENQDGTWILDPFPMVLEIISELQHGCSPGLIAARFHNGIIQLLVDGATQVSNDTGIKQIALSGGVFQNAYLSTHLESHLSKKGFDVFGHIEVPTNDGCIALGQAYIGAMHLARSTH